MKYPIFLELSGRRAVVVGAGQVAVRKAKKLLDAGARVAVVAEHFDPALDLLAQQDKNLELVKGPYSSQYLAETTLAIAATNNREVNKQVYRDCQQRNILCNVVDDPELCDFFAPAVIHRGDLWIAIGTQGYCPAYAGHIRKKLELLITEAHGKFLGELEDMRVKILEDVTDPDERKTVLGRLVDDDSMEYYTANGPQKWRQWALDLITSGSSATS
ncbi:MAG: hypothetical protein A2Y07_10195 [Planctomycetes bacterium GWF2_50_10]|nr:MAG: hypothetical protein A2Y07_10195 [Planctomycetes bacterium GWF2_50_10]